MRQVKKESITLEDLMAQLDASFPAEAPQEQVETDRDGDAAQEQLPSAAPKAPQTEEPKSSVPEEPGLEKPTLFETSPKPSVIPAQGNLVRP